MAGQNWRETSAAISAIAPICTRYDSDGIDVHFLNSSLSGRGITTASAVQSIFNSTRPCGATPTGLRLGELLRAYISTYSFNSSIKPMNIICITDGEPTDPRALENNIVWAARQLENLKAPQRQVGVQFFQVGQDEGATAALEELDNALVEEHGIRDMVDTVSWRDMNRGGGLTADGVLKAVLGAVDKALDRKRKI